MPTPRHIQALDRDFNFARNVACPLNLVEAHKALATAARERLAGDKLGHCHSLFNVRDWMSAARACGHRLPG